MDPFVVFDPNKLDSSYPWATYIPHYSASKAFKIHKKRGHALVRVAQNTRCKLYRFNEDEGRWDEIFVKDKAQMDDHCEGCGTDMRAPATVYDSTMRQYGPDPSGRTVVQGYQYIVKERGKTAEPLRLIGLCKNCAQGMGYA